MPTIIYQKGTGRKDRASFVCGKSRLPAAVATRLFKEIEGLSDGALVRKVIQKLASKHDDFLDAIDKLGLTYPQAVQEMKNAAPKRVSGKPRIGKEAIGVARMLCRKYSNQEVEAMLAGFMETIGRPEFKALVIELVNQNLEKFGRNGQGKIRVRAERKGPASKGLIDRMEKAREARKGKK